MKSNIHPIMQSLISEMGRVGLLPKSDQDMDRELELEGICALPEIDMPDALTDDTQERG